MADLFDEGERARQRELWRQALGAKAGRGRALPQQGRPLGKGMGPNKASGHKGGMGRQGSKRG